MQSKAFLIVIAVLLLAAVFFFAAGDGEEGANVAELARQQKQRETQASQQKTGLDLDQLAAEGKGQPVPANLSVHPSPDKSYWFVGDPKVKAGVEVPFSPGQLRTPPPTIEPLRENPGFVGADACQKCHQEKHAGFIETAHHRTSRLATPKTVSGPLEDGQNQMSTRDPKVNFTMVRREEQLLQRVAFHGWQFDVPFDLITGSSKMAETYLYWHRDQLFQMNVTYLSSIDQWINSPGYIDGDAAYARPIPVRCLECHTTYADFRGKPNHYTPDSLILGISCERCHGPGQQHIEYHETHPDDKVSQFVTVPSDLSREQQLDLCGQCHSGISSPKDLPFQFRPGDRFDDHFQPLNKPGESNNVHTSNQLRRLAESECFKQSEMACAECHNPHKNERGKMELFSKRCLECHQSEACGKSEELGAKISENCIDCHMPKKAGKHLRLDTAEGSIFPPLRDHYIRVDQEATEAFLKD